MQNLTIICFLSSLLSNIMGFSKTLVLKNSVAEHISTYDYNIQVTLATSYFVLAIFFSVIGSLFFFVKKKKAQKIAKVLITNSRKNPIRNRMMENMRASWTMLN